MSQTERTKKYTNKFVDKRLRLKKENFVQIEQMIKNKGYNSINEYENFTLEYDYKNNIIPCKADMLEQTTEATREE